MTTWHDISLHTPLAPKSTFSIYGTVKNLSLVSFVFILWGLGVLFGDFPSCWGSMFRKVAIWMHLFFLLLSPSLIWQLKKENTEKELFWMKQLKGLKTIFIIKWISVTVWCLSSNKRRYSVSREITHKNHCL